ncbi:hypothetical protein QJ857_gp1088 [Tupanvirus soda lake]|uniref:Uncharacterized protein n=2 Tax=Tupanvirus TaxID=2094720 RepID=A0A6N1NTN3_9VIRU|nr:hypothetical protein QJ857_gp1088 [Tupanvirus soda lake]QKU34966.1 hypothetical protein [Tupanvirus soda lake]
MNCYNMCYFNTYNDDLITSLVEMTMDQYLPHVIHNDNNTVIANLNNDNIIWELQRPFKRQVHMFLNNIYLLYVVDNKYYYDINHIITNLITTQSEHQEIYRNFSEYIDKCVYTISPNGRITRRNLVDFITVGKMAINHSCDFSKYFLFELAICLVIFFALFYLFYLAIVYYSIVYSYYRYLE